MRLPVRAALAALLLAAACLAVPAGAAARVTVTVRAARSGYVERTIPRGVTLYYEDSTATGAGEYAGYYFQPLDRPAAQGWGRMWFDDFGHRAFRGTLPMPLGALFPTPTADERPARWYVPPGRYRIHVLGDRASEARLVFGGPMERGALRTTRRSVVDAAVETLPDPATVAGTGTPHAAVADLPVTVRAGALSFAALFSVYRGVPGHGHLHWDTCIGAADGTRCVAPGQRSSGALHYREMQISGATAYTASIVARTYTGNDITPGERRAYFDVESASLVERVAVAAFSLAL